MVLNKSGVYWEAAGTPWQRQQCRFPCRGLTLLPPDCSPTIRQLLSCLTPVQGFGMMVSPSSSPERMSRPLSQPSFRRNGGSSSGSQVRGPGPTVVGGGHWLGGCIAQVAAAAEAVPGCAWLLRLHRTRCARDSSAPCLNLCSVLVSPAPYVAGKP